MSAWLTELAEAKCERDQRCAHRYDTVAGCLARTALDEAYYWYFGGIGYYEDLAAKYTLAADAVRQTCLDAVSNARCEDDQSISDLCDPVLIPSHPAGLGEPCTDPHSPYAANFGCTGDLVCSSGRPGVCSEPTSPPPAACEEDADCAPGYCGAAKRCRTVPNAPGPGEPCDEASSPDCRYDLYCSSGGATLVCVALGGRGAPCGDPPEMCKQDLGCSVDPVTGNGVCTPYLTLGDTCARSGGVYGNPATCMRESWCVFATPDATTGTCGVPPLSGSSPCSEFTFEPLSCPVGTAPDEGDGTTTEGEPNYCQCVPQLATLGEFCASDTACASGNCGWASATALTLTCLPPPAVD